MDKVEYRVKLEEMNRLVAVKDYAGAVKIADEIDWRRVRNIRTLTTVSEIYEANNKLEDSMDILMIAYDRSQIGRSVLYRMTELAIKMKEFDDAVDYYTEFVQSAPNDYSKYILKYKIYRERGSSLEDQIKILQDYKSKEYTEEWAYELAKLYEEAGLLDKCLEECEDLILWFNKGEYVYKAMELKMKHKALTPQQNYIYSKRHEVPEETEVIEESLKKEMEEKAKQKSVKQKSQRKRPETDDEFDMGIIDPNANPLADMMIEEAEREIASSVLEETKKTNPLYKTFPNTTEIPGLNKSPERFNTVNIKRAVEEDITPGEDEQEVIEKLSKGIAADVAEAVITTAKPKVDTFSDFDPVELQEKLAASMREIIAGISRTRSDETEELNYNIQKPAFTPETAITEEEVSKTIPVPSNIQNEEHLNLETEKKEAALAEEVPAESSTIPSSSEEIIRGALDISQIERNLLNAAAEIEQEAAASREKVTKEPEIRLQAKTEAVKDEVIAEKEEQESFARQPDVEDEEQILEDQTIINSAEEAVIEEPAIEKSAAEESTAEKHIAEKPIKEEDQIEDQIGNDQIEGQMTLEDILGSFAPEPYETVAPKLEKEAEKKVETDDDKPLNAWKEQQIINPDFNLDDELEEYTLQTVYEEPSDHESEESVHKEDEILAEPQEETTEEYSKEEDKMASHVPDAVADALSAYIQSGESKEDSADEGLDIEEMLNQALLGTVKADTMSTALEEAVLEAQDDTVKADAAKADTAKSDSAKADSAKVDSALDEEVVDEVLELERVIENYVKNIAVSKASEEEASPDQDAAAEVANVESDETAAADLPVMPETMLTEPGDILDHEFEKDDFAEEQSEVIEDSETKEASFDMEDLLKDTVQRMLDEKAAQPKSAAAPQVNTQAQRQILAPREEAVSEDAEDTFEVSEEDMKLSEEEKKIFSYFTPIMGMERQLAEALYKARRKDPKDKTSRNGNVVILGSHGTGKTALAINLIKAIIKDRNIKTIEIEKADASDLNNTDVVEKLGMMKEHALVIERAGHLHEKTITEMTKAMDFKTNGLLIVLEDEKRNLRTLLESHPSFAAKFNIRINVPIFTNDELVSFGKSYAKELDYRIDDMAILALYNRIGDSQTEEHPVTVADVKDMVDRAIKRAERFGIRKFIKIMTNRHYDEDDRVLLYEKDFE